MIDSFIQPEIIEETRLDLNTKLTMYVSFDGKKLHGRVSYMGNRLTTEKTEDNSVIGKMKIQEFFSKFKTGKDVEVYFNIKGSIKVSLEKVMKEIEEMKALVEEQIIGGDKKPNPATLQNRLARQRSAKATLPMLYNQYKSELSKRLLIMLVVGKGASESKKAFINSEVAFYDGDGFYKSIVSRIPPVLYNGVTSSASLFDVTSRHVEDIAADIDLASYPALIFNSSFNVKVDSEEKALDFVKKMINTQIGSEMLGYAALENVTKQAVNYSFSGPVLPMAISLEDSSLVGDLSESLKKMSKFFYVISVGKNKTKIKNSISIDDTSLESIKTAIEAIQTKQKKGE